MTLQSRIPKKIHYCWFGGKTLPTQAIKCIDSWKKFFPGYEIIEWNESNFDFGKFEYTRKAYEAKKYAFVSDMARLDILAQNGGIYFDTDVEVIKSFDEILERGGYLGIEAFKNTFRVNPGLGFACIKESPIINGLLTIYKKQVFDESKLKTCNIVTLTTDYLLDKGIKRDNEIQTIEDITIYPQDYFNPCDMSTGAIKLSSNTKSIHHFSASWVDKKSLVRGQMYRLINRFLGEKIALAIRHLWKKVK